VTDWQAEIMSRVAKQSYGHREQEHMMLRARGPWFAMIEKAAQDREVSRTVYVRRMTSLGLAHDLAQPIAQVLAQTAHWGRAMYTMDRAIRDDRGKLITSADDAAGITNWCPHPGCDGAHLR
jgi:hypothetical protein